MKQKVTLAGVVTAVVIAMGVTMAVGNNASGAEDVPIFPDLAASESVVEPEPEPVLEEIYNQIDDAVEALMEPAVVAEPLSEMDLLLQYYGYSHQASLDAIAHRPATEARQISADGLDLIKFFEGYSANGYLLGDGRCTIGWGHTVPEEELGGEDCLNWTISEEEAAEYLLQHIEFYEASVDSYFTRDFTQHQFDALVSFTYNVGEAYLKYGWSKAPTDQYFADTMMLYVKPAQFTEGLTIRRTAEVELFNTPENEQPIREIMEKLAVQRWEREQRLAAEAEAASANN